MDDYLSAGSYRPAKAVLDRRKPDGILQESAAGVAKAIGKRNVSVTDKQRALTSEGMLLRQTTELQLNAHLVSTPCGSYSTHWRRVARRCAA